MSSTPAIELQNVTVELGGRVILKDVTLTIPHKQSVVIMGPSGSGKTVLLKTMAGIFKPKTGKVLIEGEDWQSLESDEKHILASKLGMLFQQTALFDSMTALNNVKFPILEHHPERSNAELDKECEELLAKVNLLEARDKYPHELSGGMQSRLGIARALALSPEIVFYDDPTAGQDPVRSDMVANLLLDLKSKENSTTITVTSDLNIAYQMADRILLVVNQTVLDVGTPEQCQNSDDPRVQQFINGRLEGPIKWSDL